MILPTMGLLVAILAILVAQRYGAYLLHAVKSRFKRQLTKWAPLRVWIRIVWATYQVAVLPIPTPIPHLFPHATPDPTRVSPPAHQVLSKVPIIYQLRLPLSVSVLIATILPIIDLGFDGLAAAPLQCMGLHGFLPQLIFHVLLPPIAFAFVSPFVGGEDEDGEGEGEGNAETEHGVGKEAGDGVKPTLKARIEAWGQRVLPLALFISFLAFPMVSTQAFRAFVAEDFSEEGGEEVAYLKADYRVRVGTSEDALIKLIATVAILAYPVGIPATYAFLLYKARTELRSHHTTRLTECLAFLHGVFKAEFFWWELVCVSQKLVLVGFLVLTTFHPGSLTQLVLGLVAALLFAVAQMQFQPYRTRNDNFLATVCNLSIVSFFMMSVLYRVFELTTDFESVAEQLTGTWANRRFVVSLEFITITMVLSLVCGLLLLILLHAGALLDQHRAEVFRWRLDASQVLPPHLQRGQFHTFLSHNWASGQDQSRAIKTQLTALCPGIKVWLDVDNMRTKAGTSATDKESFEKLIDGIQVMSAILAGSIMHGEEYSNYFRSVPCQHELRRAMQKNMPVVFVLETDPNHGGISLAAHRRACETCCPDILPLLDKSTIVEWHRVRTVRCFASEPAPRAFLSCGD